MKLIASKITVGATKLAVIKNVNLEIHEGKTLVILGPNGSGKSTLLKALARQIPPLSGTISLDDRNIWHLSAAAFSRAVAYVPQNTDTTIQLSIEDYVALGRSPHQEWWQWQQTETDKLEVLKALECTGLLDLRRRMMSQLSGGERQRTAVAVALAQKPNFLLLDEPTAHLDFKHQADLLHLLRRLKSEQKLGMVVVLHDLSAAAFLADEILLLKKGDGKNACSEIAATGTKEHVLQSTILEDAFEVVFESMGEYESTHYFVKLDN